MSLTAAEREQRVADINAAIAALERVRAYVQGGSPGQILVSSVNAMVATSSALIATAHSVGTTP